MTDNNQVKYPNVEVELVGQDGNAFHILGAVNKALRKEGVDTATRNQYQEEATQGDYDNLLRVTMQWVTVL